MGEATIAVEEASTGSEQLAGISLMEGVVAYAAALLLTTAR